MNVPTSYDYADGRTNADAAYVAGDALILALSALNGADVDRTDPSWELAVQDAGTPFQLAQDALRGVFRALLPGAAESWLDNAVHAAYDMTGEADVTRRIVESISAEMAALVAYDAESDVNDCEGHESLSGAHMGETVFCDGTCR